MKDFFQKHQDTLNLAYWISPFIIIILTIIADSPTLAYVLFTPYLVVLFANCFCMGPPTLPKDPAPEVPKGPPPAITFTDPAAGHWEEGNYYFASAWHSTPNSVGGWSVRTRIKNIDPKGRTVKYVHFTIVARNPVWDICYCQVTGRSEVKCTFTGPLYPGKASDAIWENLWYNIVLKSVLIRTVLVEFSDGTTQTLDAFGHVTSPC